MKPSSWFAVYTDMSRYSDCCSFVKFVGRKGPLGRRKKNKGMHWLAALYRRRYPDKWTAWLALQRIEGRRIW